MAQCGFSGQGSRVPSAGVARTLASLGGYPLAPSFTFGRACGPLSRACGAPVVADGDSPSFLSVASKVDNFAIMSNCSGCVDCHLRYWHEFRQIGTFKGIIARGVACHEV